MATGVPSSPKAPAEPYELAYASKLSRQEVLALPAESHGLIDIGGGGNRLYEGDNLGILLYLLRDADVCAQARCVYIDPPYATSMAFVDRQVNHAYADTLIGARYIECIRRRLIVLRELMADDGSIFVHLDQNMIFEMKLVMDEVFGRENFRNLITRKKCNTKNYTRRKFGNVSDHILFYTKTDRYVWHRPYDAWTEDRILEEYPYVDEASGRRYKRVPLHAPGTRQGATGRPWRGKSPPPGKHWQYPPARLDELDDAGQIYWSRNGNPRRKVFFERDKGIPAQDIWVNFKDPHNQNVKITGYPTEKNYELLKRIVSATSNPGDWVLDCFCGSGTTLEAAAELGRRFIGIDQSRPAIEATIRRLTIGRKAMGDFVGKRGTRKRSAATGVTLFDLALTDHSDQAS